MGFILRKRSKIATQAFSFCCLPAHPRITIHHGRLRKGHRRIQQSGTRNGRLGLASRLAKHFINAYFSQIVLYVFSHSENRKMEFTIPRQRVRKSTLRRILCGQSLGVSPTSTSIASHQFKLERNGWLFQPTIPSSPCRTVASFGLVLKFNEAMLC